MNLRGRAPVHFDNADRLTGTVVERIGKNIVLALPLGLGKANHVANSLFIRAAGDPSMALRIFTALTLEKPHPKRDLERRFIGPVSARLFDGYPALAYADALSWMEEMNGPGVIVAKEAAGAKKGGRKKK